METPKHLGHKPILAVDDYDKIDGKYVNDYTDARALSIGKAQWNHSDFSAKVFRHTGNRWSRQSEELPLHRVLDLANLVLSAYLQKSGNYKQSTVLKEKIVDNDGFDALKAYIKENSYLEERIKELQKTIKKIS